jgi:hypothetical protein
MFPCSKCGRSDFATTRAWKAHMNRAHKGWSEKAWLEAARAASASVQPGLTQVAPPATETEGAGSGQPAAPSLSPLQQRFAAVRGKAAKALGVFTFALIEKPLKLEPLKEEDRATLAEGWEAALSLLDIQPAFSTRTIELKNPLWALLFPILALALVVAERIDYRALWEFVQPPAAKDQPDHRTDRTQGGGENDAGQPPDSGI